MTSDFVVQVRGAGARSKVELLDKWAGFVGFLAPSDAQDLITLIANDPGRFTTAVETIREANPQYFADSNFLHSLAFDSDLGAVVVRMTALDAASIAMDANPSEASITAHLVSGGVPGDQAATAATALFAEYSARIQSIGAVQAQLAPPEKGGFVDSYIESGGLDDDDGGFEDGGFFDDPFGTIADWGSAAGRGLGRAAKGAWGMLGSKGKMIAGLAGTLALDEAFSWLMGSTAQVRGAISRGVTDSAIRDLQSKIGTIIAATLSDTYVSPAEMAYAGAFAPQWSKRPRDVAQGGLDDDDIGGFEESWMSEVRAAGGPEAYGKALAAEVGGLLADQLRSSRASGSVKLAATKDLSDAYMGHRKFLRKLGKSDDCADPSSPQCTNRLAGRLDNIEKRLGRLKKAMNIASTADTATEIISTVASAVPFAGMVTAGLKGMKSVVRAVGNRALAKRQSAVATFQQRMSEADVKPQCVPQAPARRGKPRK